MKSNNKDNSLLYGFVVAGVFIVTILVYVAWITPATATNQQDDGRSYYTVNQFSLNNASDGYGSTALAEPFNFDGTGFVHIEVPDFVNITSVYTDDGLYYLLSWTSSSGALTTVAVESPLTGTGTALDPVDLSVGTGLAVNLGTLECTVESGLTVVDTESPIVGNGTALSPIDWNGDTDDVPEGSFNLYSQWTRNTSGRPYLIPDTSTDDIWTGGQLSVADDGYIFGMLHVGGSSLTVDGSTDTVDTSSNTLIVAVDDVYMQDTLHAESILVNGDSASGGNFEWYSNTAGVIVQFDNGTNSANFQAMNFQVLPCAAGNDSYFQLNGISDPETLRAQLDSGVFWGDSDEYTVMSFAKGDSTYPIVIDASLPEFRVGADQGDYDIQTADDIYAGDDITAGGVVYGTQGVVSGAVGTHGAIVVLDLTGATTGTIDGATGTFYSDGNVEVEDVIANDDVTANNGYVTSGDTDSEGQFIGQDGDGEYGGWKWSNVTDNFICDAAGLEDGTAGQAVTIASNAGNAPVLGTAYNFSDDIEGNVHVESKFNDMLMDYYQSSLGPVQYSATQGYVTGKTITITEISWTINNFDDSGATPKIVIYPYDNGAAINAACKSSDIAEGTEIIGYTTFTPGTYTVAAGHVLSIYLDVIDSPTNAALCQGMHVTVKYYFN